MPWTCRSCGKTLGEIAPGQLVQRLYGRFAQRTALPAEVERECHGCGAVNSLTDFLTTVAGRHG